MTIDSVRVTGSRPLDQAPSGLGGSRFDPARVESALYSALDDRWRTLGSLGFECNTQQLVGPARRLIQAGKVESRSGPGYVTLYRRTA